MKVFLHKLAKREDGLVDLTVSFGSDPPKNYRASYDGSDDKYKIGSIDEELFMALSDLAHKHFGHCVVYQMELMEILRALNDGDELPELPAEFGTTEFCTLRPSRLRIAWNKLKTMLYKLKVLPSRTWVHPDYRKTA
ncbi:MAG: hypothetical protein KDA42_19245 [Planctomycetales bacterium]|nr:hypothetical protein [Planctomycetales bacterium]